MHSLRIVSVFLLLILISLGTTGGCGGDDENDGLNVIDGGELSGELNCTDGIDNDGDTEIDCDDIDCILDPECKDDETLADDDDDNTPPGDNPADDTPETPILNEPINDRTLRQNDPDIGCPFNPFSGFGFEIFFDWTDSEASSGIAGYQLFVIGPSAVFPLVDTFVTESEFTYTSCNSFVIDSNLSDWEWTVQAVGSNGEVTKIEKLSEVSETQTFQFEPCRFNDGTGCGGHPPTEPTIEIETDITTPILIEPIDNQAIKQNNPDIGCPFSENFGFGHEIFFDWTDSESPNGIVGYEIFAIGGNAIFPIIHTFATESEFTDTSCNSFVIDANLENWTWNVTAVDNQGNKSEVSETKVFRFEECRLEGGVPCNAQP